MKKETVFSIFTFVVVAVVAFCLFNFIPDTTIQNATTNGSIFTILGNGMISIVGMRVIISFCFALIVTLLIRIVDTEENTAKKSQPKQAKKETK